MHPTIGDFLVIEYKTRADLENTLVKGQVIGVAESFSNPDSSRVLIAGLDNWIDLADKAWARNG